MLDNIAKVVLLSAFCGLVGGSIAYAIKEYRLLKARVETEIEARKSIMNSLCMIAHHSAVLLEKQKYNVSYVEELRMYHSCIDCQFLAQCQSDSDLEDVQFDYLVCENFSEVIR